MVFSGHGAGEREAASAFFCAAARVYLYSSSTDSSGKGRRGKRWAIV